MKLVISVAKISENQGTALRTQHKSTEAEAMSAPQFTLFPAIPSLRFEARQLMVRFRRTGLPAPHDLRSRLKSGGAAPIKIAEKQ
jgi:hypothetical protein